MSTDHHSLECLESGNAEFWQGRLRSRAKPLPTHLARSNVSQALSSVFQQLPGYGGGHGTVRGEHDSRLSVEGIGVRNRRRRSGCQGVGEGGRQGRVKRASETDRGAHARVSHLSGPFIDSKMIGRERERETRHPYTWRKQDIGPGSPQTASFWCHPEATEARIMEPGTFKFYTYSQEEAEQWRQILTSAPHRQA